MSSIIQSDYNEYIYLINGPVDTGEDGLPDVTGALLVSRADYDDGTADSVRVELLRVVRKLNQGSGYIEYCLVDWPDRGKCFLASLLGPEAPPLRPKKRGMVVTVRRTTYHEISVVAATPEDAIDEAERALSEGVTGSEGAGGDEDIVSVRSDETGKILWREGE
jgi:hypothetical protein